MYDGTQQQRRFFIHAPQTFPTFLVGPLTRRLEETILSWSPYPLINGSTHTEVGGKNLILESKSLMNGFPTSSGLFVKCSSAVRLQWSKLANSESTCWPQAFYPSVGKIGQAFTSADSLHTVAQLVKSTIYAGSTQVKPVYGPHQSRPRCSTNTLTQISDYSSIGVHACSSILLGSDRKSTWRAAAT